MTYLKLMFTSVALLMVLLTTGCATVTRGTTEAYVVNTNPAGAQVNSSSGWSCTTPCSVKVKRRGDFVLTIDKPGYEPVTATISSSIDGAGAAGMAGNVILGGIIGAGIDAGTGAMHSHKPNPLHVDLQKSDIDATTAMVAARTSAIMAVQTASFAPPAPASTPGTAQPSLSLDDFDCAAPRMPPAVPVNADKSQLLDARRSIDRYQEENDVYQECLLTLSRNADAFGVDQGEVLSAYDHSITFEKAVAEEFNHALEAYEDLNQ